jgi:catechol 2,3-dioxygenase-like lactoylglutathione lyase family enzyme
MFSHIMIGSNDMARSKKFYDALFIAMGGQPATEEPRGRLAYSHNGGRFMVTKPIDGSEATHANGGTIGFQMKDAAQAEAWHNAGVANGGTSIEDPASTAVAATRAILLACPDAVCWHTHSAKVRVFPKPRPASNNQICHRSPGGGSWFDRAIAGQQFSSASASCAAKELVIDHLPRCDDP